jgi:hypothetical protein
MVALDRQARDSSGRELLGRQQQRKRHSLVRLRLKPRLRAQRSHRVRRRQQNPRLTMLQLQPSR